MNTYEICFMILYLHYQIVIAVFPYCRQRYCAGATIAPVDKFTKSIQAKLFKLFQVFKNFIY